MLNSRDIDRLRPDVAANCRIWVERCRERGLAVCVTSTVRDREYQEYLYAQGRTRPGRKVTNGRTPTFHWDKAGLAFDFCQNVRGHEFDDPGFFREAAAVAKEMGFSWGGDWKSFPDQPHIQWDHGGEWTGRMILAGYLPPDMLLWSGEEDDEMSVKRYQTIAECPEWARPYLQDLVDRGALKGDGTTDSDGNPAGLDLSMDMVRLLVVRERDR